MGGLFGLCQKSAKRRNIFVNKNAWRAYFQTDLARERERHLTTGKSAETTKFDFRRAICSSAIGQASCLICARSRQLTFPFCLFCC